MAAFFPGAAADTSAVQTTQLIGEAVVLGGIALAATFMTPQQPQRVRRSTPNEADQLWPPLQQPGESLVEGHLTLTPVERPRGRGQGT